MKKTVFIFCLFLLSGLANAKSKFPQFSHWAIHSDALDANTGNLLINADPTTFSFDFTLNSRAIDVDAAASTLYVTAVYVENDQETPLSDPIIVTPADYNGSGMYIGTDISASIPADKTAGIVYLKYANADNSISYYFIQSYQITNTYSSGGTGGGSMGGQSTTSIYGIIGVKSFEIPATYLTYQNLIVNQNPTNFTFDFKLIKINNNSTTPNVDCTVQLVYAENTSSAEIALSSPVSITTADYGSGDEYSRTSIAANIPGDKKNGRIYLKLIYLDYTYNVYKTVYALANYGIMNTISTTGATTGGVPHPGDIYYGIPNAYSGTLLQFCKGCTIAPSEQIQMSGTAPILTVDGNIYSQNHTFRLTLQQDGNLVLYLKNADGSETGLWASNTEHSATKATSLWFQNDGNLVLFDSNHNSVWASMKYHAGVSMTSSQVAFKPFYVLQNDGNFVMYWPEYHTCYDPSVDILEQPYYNAYGLVTLAATNTNTWSTSGGMSPNFGNMNPIIPFGGATHLWTKAWDGIFNISQPDTYNCDYAQNYLGRIN